MYNVELNDFKEKVVCRQYIHIVYMHENVKVTMVPKQKKISSEWLKTSPCSADWAFWLSLSWHPSPSNQKQHQSNQNGNVRHEWGPSPLLLLRYETLQTFFLSISEGGRNHPPFSQNGRFHYKTEKTRLAKTLQYKQLFRAERWLKWINIDVLKMTMLW